jgi:hypothetical protein
VASHAAQLWNASAYIGSDNFSLSARSFGGSLDEVAIYPYAMSGAQVQNLYNGVVATTPPQLSIRPMAGNVVLTWDRGMLLQANDVTGPWTTNTLATSPWTNTASGSRTFYRAYAP